jgi:pimeloyl-ACP methyl ester carboxylesterase
MSHHHEDPYFGYYRDGWFNASNLRLHYTEWNPGGAVTVVMVHGVNVQLHTWDPVAQLLANDYRVICVDLRGHGDSEWATEGYRLEYFVSDLVELSDQLHLEPFELVGHSLGARIAVAFAAECPERVMHVVLSDTGPETTRAGALAAVDIVGGAQDIRGFRNEDEAIAYFEKAHPEWLPEFRTLHLHYQLRLNWAGKLVFKADPDLFWILGSVAKRETPILWEAAAKIAVPTLLCVGESSPFFDDELIERTQAGFRNLTVQYFPTGHYIPRERPVEFVDAVREFCTAST